MNPLNQSHSGTAPKTSRNPFSTNQETNEDDSQTDPHPELGIFHNQTTQNSGPEEGHDLQTVKQNFQHLSQLIHTTGHNFPSTFFIDYSCELRPRVSKLSLSLQSD